MARSIDHDSHGGDNKMRLCKLFGVLVAIALFASVASAAPVTLQSLLSGGTLTVGDKVFGDFSFQCSTGDCTGQGITPGNISVEATFDAVNDIGYLQFTGNMVSSALVDFLLKYSVATTSGAPLLTMIDQSFNLSSGGNGGNITIGEDVRSGSFLGSIVANSSISFVFGTGDFQDPPAETGDNLNIDPALAKAYVTKDINLHPNDLSVIGTSALTQSFHESVPEPTSLALVGTGLLSLAFARKKLKTIN
jgi:hypothetical protein